MKRYFTLLVFLFCVVFACFSQVSINKLEVFKQYPDSTRIEYFVLNNLPEDIFLQTYLIDQLKNEIPELMRFGIYDNNTSCFLEYNESAGEFNIDVFVSRINNILDDTQAFEQAISDGNVSIPDSFSKSLREDVAVIGGGGDCEHATAFCTDSSYNYQNTIYSGFPDLPRYGCVCELRNPSWFYMQVEQEGDFVLYISQTSGDVDYVCWGPFDNVTCDTSYIRDDFPPGVPCGLNWDGEGFGNIVDCAFSTNDVEVVKIHNAQVGKFYMLAIANFSNSLGQITFTQTNKNEEGSGRTFCNSVSNCLISSITVDPICDPAAATLSLSGLINHAPFLDGGNGSIEVCVGDVCQTIMGPFPGPIPYSLLGVVYTVAGSTQEISATYTSSIEDAQCTRVSNFVMPDCIPTITPDFTLTEVLCHDATTSVTFTGIAVDGCVFNWDFGDANIVSGSGQGPYVLSFPSAGSKTVSLNIIYNDLSGNVLDLSSQETIIVPTEINATISTEPSLCFGSSDGKANVQASGASPPYSYNWGEASASTTESANDLSSGIYVITITDANGCDHTESFEITQPEVLVASASISSPILCYGETATITLVASGGLPPYTGIGDYTEVLAGEHTYMLTDANDCTADILISVPQPDSLHVNLEIKDPIKCFGGEAVLVVSAEGGVLPYTGTGEFTVLAGEYSYQVTDANACLGNIPSIIVNEPELLVANVEITEEIKCFGEHALLTVSASGGTAPYTSVGTYNVPVGLNSYEVVDVNGCKDNTSIEVTQPDKLVLTGSSVNNLCKGYEQGKINLDILGGVKPYIYSWTPAISTSNLLTDLPDGNYSVLVTDKNGCTVTDKYTITSPDRLWMEYKTTDILCYGSPKGEVEISAGGGVLPYVYKISSNQVSKLANSFVNLYAGRYIISVIDANNCSLSSNIEIFQNPEIVAAYELTRPSCIGSGDGQIDFKIIGGIPPYSIKWDDNISESESLTDLHAGKFNFFIEDDINCVVNLKHEVVLQDNPVDCLVVPNAFTPNGDGINDVWIIENIEMFPTATVRVYNRWGQELWYGGCYDKWDGTYKGNKVPSSTYTYTISLFNGSDDLSGMVTVVY